MKRRAVILTPQQARMVENARTYLRSTVSNANLLPYFDRPHDCRGSVRLWLSTETAVNAALLGYLSANHGGNRRATANAIRHVRHALTVVTPLAPAVTGFGFRPQPGGEIELEVTAGGTTFKATMTIEQIELLRDYAERMVRESARNKTSLGVTFVV